MDDNTTGENDQISAEKLESLDVHFETGNSYLVTIDGEDRVIPKTLRNELVVDHGITGFFSGEEPLTFHAGDTRIRKVGDHSYQLSFGNGENTVLATPDYEEDVIRAIKDTLESGFSDKLDEVFSKIASDLVRQDTIDQLYGVDGFDEDRIDITENGWVVDDQYLVTYSGENYSLDDRPTYTLRGHEGGLKSVHDDHQALDVTLDVSAVQEQYGTGGVSDVVVEVEGRDGLVTLYQKEIEFLSTVRLFLNPEEAFPPEVAQRINDHEPLDAEGPFSDVTETARETGFRDNKSGVWHDHDIDKHVSDFSTLRPTDELKGILHFNFFDHLGPWEMLYRESELRQSPKDLFEDVPNDNDQRWDQVRGAANHAQIDQDHMEMLEDMFGARDE